MNNNILITLLSLIPFMYSCCPYDHVEKVKIRNSVSGETIFLKYYSWGLDAEMNVISLESKASSPDTLSDYVDNPTSAYFYKIEKDTLLIVGSWDKSNIGKSLSFSTKIIHVALSNSQFSEWCRMYKIRGYSIFPPSFAEFAKNY